MDLDFLAIGDITTDAFIRLTDAKVNCDDGNENCMLSMRFGDKIPYEFVEVVRAVGNSANAAVSAARLGLRSALMASMGDDQNGTECLAELTKNGVSTEAVTIEKGRLTNYHYVLWFEADRTILIKQEKYPYALPASMKVPGAKGPRWIYFSSVGEDSLPFHDEVAAYLAAHPETKLAFQPGTYQMKFGKERLAELYKHTEVFICNVEEAERILDSHPAVGVPRAEAVIGLMKGIRVLGPRMVVLTDGPNGAYTLDDAGMFFMPIYPDPKPPYERTGAGDAFASTLVTAIALGLPVAEALRWAPINSMSVVQYIGAQKGLLAKADLEKFLAVAPADYQPTALRQ